MTARIKAICSLIEKSECLADIGCDHGYNALYAAKIGCKSVIAADISPFSVEKARKNLSGYDCVKFVVSDGFNGIDDAVDFAVITGMGGKKIAEILDGAKTKIATLLLGPQHDADFLREYLTDKNYFIDADIMVEEDGKFYSFIRAKLGKSQTLDFVQKNYGVYYKEKNEDLKRFALKEKDKLLSFASTDENERKLEAIKEILSWQA